MGPSADQVSFGCDLVVRTTMAEASVPPRASGTLNVVSDWQSCAKPRAMPRFTWRNIEAVENIATENCAHS